MKLESEIRFHVGDKEHAVKTSDVASDMTLNTYLRDRMHLTGTKKMCLEGGCGTCIVAAEMLDNNGMKRTLSINSCLVSIFSCHGWKILSNEGIGGPLTGYHKIQRALADNNGSQCGFCSSGMVMNMYALNQSGKQTKEQIEKAFGGNLCRCTGYRPILTAFKTFASDADKKIELDDLEDIKPCRKSNCANDCARPCSQRPVYFEAGESKWMKVYHLQDLLNVLKTVGNKTYQLVAGNTARGVYWPTSQPDVYIDINNVAELTTFTATADSVTLGGTCSLSYIMEKFYETGKAQTQFSYLTKMADHLDLVAHVPVRNIGTIAGNLMIKHQHQEFPSDVFLILETVNATLVIVDLENNIEMVSPQDFLKVNMNKKVIKQIVLDAFDSTYSYTSYKIMPRAQNAHAMVNAGFLFKLDTANKVQSARIIYGGINPSFIHAKNAEMVLKSKNLFDNSTIQAVLKALDLELVPDWVLPDPRPEFRKKLAKNLFYKCVLALAKDIARPKYRSGGSLLFRPVSNGTQQIYSEKDKFPLTQPIIKLEALAQTSGQAKYILDIPNLPNQLHGILIQARAVAGSTLTGVDASAALARPDVVGFFSANDIPGVNNIAVASLSMSVVEELFCNGKVKYYSQPVGILVASTHDAAVAAAPFVKVSTSPSNTKPLLNVRDVLNQGKMDRVTHQTSFIRKNKGNDIKTVIKGETYIEGQYHFHMETQNCLVVPTEDGLNIFPGTQWMDHLQGAVSQILNVPSQRINMFVRRLGGGFGSKLSRNAFITGAAALAAQKLNRPVSIWMQFHENMDIIGKRFPCLCRYEVGVNASGKIQYLDVNLYSDFGVGGNESVDSNIIAQFQNCYLVDTWKFDTYTVTTDNSAFCYARAPGSLEGLACIETIMDHIALTLNLDPLDVRKQNLDRTNNPIMVEILTEMETTDDIANRKKAIAAYNEANRWKKKALSVVPMKYILEVLGTFTTLVSIYHLDGGVAVSHGGIEMGQGINTKVVQVCAYKFNIPIEKVSVKPSYNVAAPNSFMSGGSLTSEAVVYALLRACDVLLDRIKPIRDKNPTATWEQLIQLCYTANVNLSSNGFFSPAEPNIQEYPIYGCCALELEVDILTGKQEISRVDIIEDVGRSMSPLIDIGQLEGAFVMGLGYYSTEELVFDQNTGRLTNNRTWNYKVMGARDIPADFRVKFTNNTYNPVGVLKSKAIAEPPTCLTISLPLAIRSALAGAMCYNCFEA
ncbi:xanthine dehydrogenase-like [Sitophilus oryzae]|uniref:Indole-3-acetaldehyde oxidase n=1 Tax=Sitophilus oryzae TaxID=7048 RepID=A0A6J2X5T7_SITOR|nr:xanthine dehydrogenase-like [Sitophilus oryzae]